MRQAVPTDTARNRVLRLKFALPHLWLLGLAIALGLAAGDCALAEELLTRFRVQIQSPGSGELSVSAGQLEKLQPLNLDPEAAAASWIRKGRVLWQHLPERAMDAFDVTVRAPRDAELAFKIGDRKSAAISLADLRATTLDEPLSFNLEPGGNRVELTRYPDDRLRIETERESLLFRPGQTFDFKVLADPAGIANGSQYNLTATLARGRSGGVIWESVSREVQATSSPATLPFSIPLPKQQGVYRVVLRADKPRSFRSRYLPATQLLQADESLVAERTFQVAVVDPQARPTPPGNWQEVYTYDPRTQHWPDRIPEWMRWRRLPWFATGPINSEGRSDRASLRENAVEIATAPESGTAHWRAYPLPINEPGANYLVEVEPLGASDSELTVAVLEPDALGDLRPVSGCITHRQTRWNRNGERKNLQLMVRPRTTSPLLVLANPNGTQAARFGRLRVLKSRGGEVISPSHDRRIGLDFADRDLPHTLGASHVASEVGRFEHADLQTYLESAALLADRVELAGGNSATITVNENGAAIYDSSLWSSPAQDLSVWAEGTADLPRRELLAAILREFERRDLKLVLAFRLDAPTTGSVARQRVDRAAILNELMDQASGSKALAGVALRSSAAGWLGENLESPQERDRDLQALERLVQRRIKQPLLVLPGELSLDPNVGPRLAPRLGGSSPTAEKRLSVLASLSQHASVSLPFGSDSSLAAARSPASTALQSSLRRALGVTGPTSRHTLYAAATPLRLIRSAQRLRNRESAGDILLPAIAADPNVELRLLAQGAASSQDLFTSGHAASGVADAAAAATRRLLTTLPLPSADVRQREAITPIAKLDVTATAYESPNGKEGHAVIVNQCAWPRTARVTLVTPNRVFGTRRNEATAPAADGQWFEPGRHAMEFDLQPYETVAWSFSTGELAIEGLRVAPSEAALQELNQAVDVLKSRDTRTRRVYKEIRNTSFEQVTKDGTRVDGWSFRGQVEIDPEIAAEGSNSLRLVATPDQAATVTSDRFPCPRTGQLVLDIACLPARLSEESELLIEVEQIGGNYRNRARLVASQLATNKPDEEPDWLPIVFPIDDLPLIEGADLQIRLTLSGDGELRLDNVNPEDLILPLDGYGAIDLRAERFAVVRMLQTSQNLLDEGRHEACRELLDGYWPRFLASHFPARKTEKVVADSEKDSKTESANEPPGEEQEESTPSLSERFRGYLWPWR